MDKRQRQKLARARGASHDYRRVEKEAKQLLVRAGRQRQQAIQSALSAGTPVQEVAEATQLSRQRIHQITNGQ
jgi:sarcosine oxidase gamma subunit